MVTDPPRIDTHGSDEGRRDGTRDLLLASGRVLFAEVGYAGASVRDIASDAGVNSALVRYHFGSKDGLYSAVLEVVFGELRDALLMRFAQVQPGGDLLEALLDGYVDFLTVRADNPRLLQRALLDDAADTRDVVRRALMPALAAIREAQPREGQTLLGNFDDVLMTVFSGALVPFLYSPLLSGLLDRDPTEPGAISRRRHHLRALIRAAMATLDSGPI